MGLIYGAASSVCTMKIQDLPHKGKTVDTSAHNKEKTTWKGVILLLGKSILREVYKRFNQITPLRSIHKHNNSIQ